MPRRSFPTELWTEDEWFESLEPLQRYLFWYLWGNSHCKQSGLYYLPLRTMSNETKLMELELTDLLKKLAPKVAWYPDKNLIWVKNFIKNNSRSATFLEGVVKCLGDIKEKGVVKDLIEYNYDIHSISIPYENSNDTPPISSETPFTITNTTSKDKSKTITVGDGLKQVFGGLLKRRNYASRTPGGEGKAIKDMFLEGFGPDDILKAYDIIKARPFWEDKSLTMMTVKKDIHEVLKGGTHKQGSPEKGGYKEAATRPLH